MRAKYFLTFMLLALCLSFSPTAAVAGEDQTDSEPRPPAPPILENFQATPQLSLFPRLGDFRPEEDEERLPFWNTYREHLLKTSGVVLTDSVTGNRAFSFRGIKGIDSTGFFAPLAVEPGKNYLLKLKLKAELEDAENTGVGVLEFHDFLWIAEQYTESLHQTYFLGAQELLRINGTKGWQNFEFNFTTGAQTGMIHLIFFREGQTISREPVILDDISLTETLIE